MADVILKNAACDAIDGAVTELAVLSAEIWQNPETEMKESHAHDEITQILEKHGFKVERSFIHKTAFRATYGFGTRSDGPNVCIICQYDAIPELGHACGHNLAAEVSVGAGIGLMAALKENDKAIGQVTVLGTPGTHDVGGIVDLINADAFRDIDVAIMSHPFHGSVSMPVTMARQTMAVTYTGKASHAAGYPWEGVNALDAAVMCYQGISCLRQQIKSNWRVHCIILEGGSQVTITPERTRLHVAYSAPDIEMPELKVKVEAVITSAASATSCEVECKRVGNPSSSIVHNSKLVRLYEANLSRFEAIPNDTPEVFGSTHIGNVSLMVPSIHPLFDIGGQGVIQSRQFAKDAGDSKAQPFAISQAKALALTGIDVMLNKDILHDIKMEFCANVQREA